MIVIVAPNDDFHTIVVHHVIVHRFGERCVILDLNSFPADASLGLNVDNRRHQAFVRLGEDVIDWSEVTCVWWRRPRLLANRELPATRRGHELEVFVRRESASLVTSFFSSHIGRVVNQPPRPGRGDLQGNPAPDRFPGGTPDSRHDHHERPEPDR